MHVTVVVTEYDDDNTTVEYQGCEKLSAEQAAALLVVILDDTLGESPQVADVMAIQRGMMQALTG